MRRSRRRRERRWTDTRIPLGYHERGPVASRTVGARRLIVATGFLSYTYVDASPYRRTTIGARGEPITEETAPRESDEPRTGADTGAALLDRLARLPQVLSAYHDPHNTRRPWRVLIRDHVRTFYTEDSLDRFIAREEGRDTCHTH